MTIEFFAGMITIILLFMCLGLIYGLTQVVRLSQKTERFVDTLERDMVPILRETELLIRELRDTFKNADRQMDRVESSLIVLEDVARTATKFKKEVLTKANKASIAGFLAAGLGMWKGKDVLDKVMGAKRKKG